MDLIFSIPSSRMMDQCVALMECRKQLGNSRFHPFPLLLNRSKARRMMTGSFSSGKFSKRRWRVN